MVNGVPLPKMRDKAIVHPNPFDSARFGMAFVHSSVEVIEAEPAG